MREELTAGDPDSWGAKRACGGRSPRPVCKLPAGEGDCATVCVRGSVAASVCGVIVSGRACDGPGKGAGCVHNRCTDGTALTVPDWVRGTEWGRGRFYDGAER